MGALAAEVLEEWRDAGRVLRPLPPSADERQQVLDAIEALRELYQRVSSDTIPQAGVALADAAARIEETRRLLRDTRARRRRREAG